MQIEIDPKAKALIFDVDGTLADTMPVHYRTWQEICNMHNFEYPKELFYELAGIPTLKIISILNKKLGCNLEPVSTEKMKRELYIKRINEVVAIKPVVDIVNKYYGKLPMALGTGSNRIVNMHTIKAIGVEGCFDVMVTAEDVTNHKPAPDTFLKCSKEMNVFPEFCQVFEDGKQGLEAARSAGMIVTDVMPYITK